MSSEAQKKTTDAYREGYDRIFVPIGAEDTCMCGAEDTCMCGAPMKDHGYDNHMPVSMADYYRNQEEENESES